MAQRKANGEKDDAAEVATDRRTERSYGCEVVRAQPVNDPGEEQY